MKAAVLRSTGVITVEEVDEPVVRDGEVEVQVAWTGICGSEVHAYRGTHPFRTPPVILGHELAGRVVATGNGVKGVAIGDRVTVMPQSVCMKCHYCRIGCSHLCDSKKVLGTKAWSGSFGEFITVPERVVYKIPDTIDDEIGALIEPLAVGVHAVRLARPLLGDVAWISGAGTIGLSTLLAAQRSGVQTTVVTDVFDFNLDVAKSLGATAVVNVARDDPTAVINELTHGLGVQLTFVTAGVKEALRSAIRGTRKRGKIVVIALFHEPASLDLFDFVGTERTLIGSQMYIPSDFDIALQLAVERSGDLKKLITHRLPIDEVEKGFAVAAGKAEDGVKVLLHH